MHCIYDGKLSEEYKILRQPRKVYYVKASLIQEGATRYFTIGDGHLCDQLFVVHTLQTIYRRLAKEIIKFLLYLKVVLSLQKLR